jgi:hypothetical protein
LHVDRRRKIKMIRLKAKLSVAETKRRSKRSDATIFYYIETG